MINMDDNGDSKTYYTIREVAQFVNRRSHTIRDWERQGRLPAELLPIRTERGWRVWTRQQIDGILDWMTVNDMRSGKGLVHYHPDAETIARGIAGQRRPRKVSV